MAKVHNKLTVLLLSVRIIGPFGVSNLVLQSKILLAQCSEEAPSLQCLVRNLHSEYSRCVDLHNKLEIGA